MVSRDSILFKLMARVSFYRLLMTALQHLSTAVKPSESRRFLTSSWIPAELKMGHRYR